MAIWIDFAELRRSLRFADVLRDYNVELKVKGDQATCFCPLPGHNGQRRTPSFSADLKKGIFQCFGCGAKGNILDFAVLMDGGDPDVGQSIRAAALQLQKRYGSGGTPPKIEAPGDSGKRKTPRAASAVASASKPIEKGASTDAAKPRLVNVPIDFELKHLDPKHPYLYDRGLTDETIAHFGLGFCARGLLADRIAIPIHDPAGKLIAYAGRLVDDLAVSHDSPKYLFPGDRERAGVIHEFKKGLLLYNLHQLPKDLEALIVVEGFASVWWLRQCGIEHAVAVMGASCSQEQGKLIVGAVRPSGRVLIFTDGDSAGERCALSIFNEVAPQRDRRWMRLADGKQPTDFSAEELDELFG